MYVPSGSILESKPCNPYIFCIAYLDQASSGAPRYGHSRWYIPPDGPSHPDLKGSDSTPSLCLQNGLESWEGNPQDCCFPEEQLPPPDKAPYDPGASDPLSKRFLRECKPSRPLCSPLWPAVWLLYLTPFHRPLPDREPG